MPTVMHTMMVSRRGLSLGVGLVALGTLLAGCGSGKSSSTSASSTSVTLKRLEVRVSGSSSAQAPGPSFMVRFASLLGWPQIAEAGTGVPKCQVSAPGPNGVVTTQTDTNGKAILDNVLPGSTATVACPGFLPLSFVVSGPPGAIIEVKVEAKNGALVVTSEAEDPSPSEPSVSDPSPPKPGSSSGSG